MPTTSTRHPPLTLKQAKKAYQKSGAIRGLSETDLKHLERAALLQERADRIKKREAQKLINRRKRLEKEQKEREARKKMGIPEPNKVYLSPRQERLSQFVRGGGKSKEQNEEDCTRAPLEDLERSDQSLEDLLVDQSCLLEHASPLQPLQLITPDRRRVQDDQSPCALAGKTASTQSDDWAAFFVSNTQIERELTEDELETPQKNPESMSTYKRCANLAEEGTAELLGYLVTQDLDFDMDETEDIIPIEETLPMFPSDGADFSEDEFTDLKFKAKVEGSNSVETEGLMLVLMTQDLDFTDDELERLAPKQEAQGAAGNERMREQLRSGLDATLKNQPAIKWATEGLTTTAVERGSKHADQATAPVNYAAEDFDFSPQDLLELESAVQKVSKGSSQTVLAVEYYAEDFDLEDFDLSEEDLQELIS